MTTRLGAGLITLRVLGTDVAVRADVAEQFADLPRSDARPTAVVTDEAPATALAELTRLAVEHSPLLCIHAGVVSGPDGLIAIPGQSGLGKTTLAAALVRAGFGYVSDEALAVDRTSGQVTAFARPLALAADVWTLLGPDIGAAPPDGTERLVAPTLLGRVAPDGGVVRDIVLAERGRRTDGAVRVEPAPRGDAVPALLGRAFNHYRDPEGSFRAVVGMVREARVWRASYAQAPELAECLGELLGVHSAAATEAR
jgi:hypothetical protein